MTVTRYEVAYDDETIGRRTVLGFIARRSGAGLLAFIRSNDLAQNIVARLDDDVMVAKRRQAWEVTTPTGHPLGRFSFTGRTYREAKGPGDAGYPGHLGVAKMVLRP